MTDKEVRIIHVRAKPGGIIMAVCVTVARFTGGAIIAMTVAIATNLDLRNVYQHL